MTAVAMNANKVSMPEGWVKSGFPATVGSTKQSLKFVKRLVALGFSQILFLRTDVPDDCFKDHEIGDLDLKMLKAKSSYESANRLIKGLANAMDALDKGYLRQIVIVIMEDKTKPEEAHETYTFTFNKPIEGEDTNPGFTIVQKSKNNASSKNDKGGLGDSSIVENDNVIDFNNNPNSEKKDQYTIYQSTKRLLKKLTLIMQDLDELPQPAFMTVQIGYHDDITPEDYQPRGFQESATGISFVENVAPKKLGQVNSNFHQIEMSIASKGFNSQANESAYSEQEIRNDNMNVSFIPLTPGLDASELDQSRQENQSVDLSHGNNVENVDPNPTKETPKKLGKISKETQDFVESNRPGAHGDVANTSMLSIQSKKSVRSIRRISSARDTFSEDASFEDNHKKASRSITTMRI